MKTGKDRHVAEVLIIADSEDEIMELLKHIKTDTNMVFLQKSSPMPKGTEVPFTETDSAS